MEKTRLIAILVFAISLAVQAVNFAGMALYRQAIKDIDTVNNNDNLENSNRAYIAFVFAASSIASLMYIYLLVVKISDKTPSIKADWFVMHLVLITVFGIAFLLSVLNTNTQVSYDTLMDTLDSGVVDGTPFGEALST